MNSSRRQSVDRNGKLITIGARVRILQLSGEWLDLLPEDERADVESMIGDVFSVEEIDENGQPWVTKNWPDDANGTCRSHSVGLEPNEMECVGDASDSDADA